MLKCTSDNNTEAIAWLKRALFLLENGAVAAEGSTTWESSIHGPTSLKLDLKMALEKEQFDALQEAIYEGRVK